MTASAATTAASGLDQELYYILTLLLGLKLSDDDDALISDDDNDNVPSTASMAMTAASNHSDVTWDINAIFITDDDDASLP